MDLNAWLKEFRALHDEKKRGSLTGGHLSGYYAARDELAGALLAAQRIAVDSRRAARCACPLRFRRTSRSSTGSCACLRAASPPVDSLLYSRERPGWRMRSRLRSGPRGAIPFSRARASSRSSRSQAVPTFRSGGSACRTPISSASKRWCSTRPSSSSRAGVEPRSRKNAPPPRHHHGTARGRPTRLA